MENNARGTFEMSKATQCTATFERPLGDHRLFENVGRSTYINVSRLLLVLCVALYVSRTQCFTVDDEARALGWNVSEYAAMHGFRLDKVFVITDDGWRLEVHRIRNMALFNESLSTPTLLSHGYGCSSVDYMVNPRNESIAFLLADRGYDVWSINYRGNKFSSRKIVNGREVIPPPKDFYKATWQYMAEYDVPAVLEKITAVTHQDKIHIVGQSMGTTVMFAFLSENHKFNDKITTMIGMAPVAKLGGDASFFIRSGLLFVTTMARFSFWVLYEVLFGQPMLASRRVAVNTMAQYSVSALCRLSPRMCAVVVDIIFQRNPLNALRRNVHLKLERMRIYFLWNPAGISLMNCLLYASQYKKNPWMKMDYDRAPQTGFTNRQEYNQTKPPTYDFTNIKVPLAMYFVKNDVFTGMDTTKRLISELKLKRQDYKIIDGHSLSHQDVLWASDARCWIYDSVIARLDNIEKGRGPARSNYFTNTVPRYLDSLQLEHNCE